jgi:hypothetical protein
MTRLPLRLAGRLIGFLVASFFLGIVASAIAAAVAKRRLVSIGGPEDDEVELVAIFGSLDFRSVARSFRRGSLLSWFAGTQLDLRGATLDPAGGDLEVRTIFAGTNVVVPEGWRVSVDGPAIFGANSARTGPEPEPGAPELRIRALALFGGTSVSAEAWDLAASEKTVVIAPDSAAGGAEPEASRVGPEAAGAEPEAAGPTAEAPEAAPATTDPEPLPAATPKRRRRRVVADAPAASDQDSGGDGSPTTEPG